VDITQVFEMTVLQGSSTQIQARIVGLNGVNIQQGDIDSITWHSWYAKQPTVQVGTGSLVITTVIYDTLQSWEEDSIGANFLWTTPSSLFSVSQVTFVAVTLLMLDGTALKLKIRVNITRTIPG